MKKNPLEALDIREVRSHYFARKAVSKQLREIVDDEGHRDRFLDLALGISNFRGNYSASDHQLGDKILYFTSADGVYTLARRIGECATPGEMLDAIYKANVPFLKIGVGSEIAMMLRPKRFWVANTRSIWANLLIKHGFNYKDTNNELRLYRDQETTSKMDYQLWAQIYPEIKKNFAELGRLADLAAEKQGVKTGRLRYIWFDAIASALYEERNES